MQGQTLKLTYFIIDLVQKNRNKMSKNLNIHNFFYVIFLQEQFDIYLLLVY